MERYRRIVKRFCLFVLVLFTLMNILAYFHASKFTNFDVSANAKTKDATRLTTAQKIKTLFLGVNNPRPQDDVAPNRPFKTIRIKSNKAIECWLMEASTPKGTVILFHGFSASKSSLLDKAAIFLNMGYNTLLVDFMGSGGSAGNQTTIGFYEALEVKSAVDYVKSSAIRNKQIVLFGSSMGAVAIMKYVTDNQPLINAVILECPFGSMLKTVQARFKTMHVPAFPMANLLVFWGGFENNFDAFKHKPTDYAKGIKCPVLLLYGERDDKVSRQEINSIYANLQGSKKLETYPLAGHEDYFKLYQKQWTADITAFLDKQPATHISHP